jgi:hypothetical protein
MTKDRRPAYEKAQCTIQYSPAGPRWRGRIEHVQSDECAAFPGLDGMLDFIRRFGAMADDVRQPVKKDGMRDSGTTMD